VDGGRFGLEQDLPAGAQARRDQVLDHFLLAVDGDASSAGEVTQRDAVAPSLEAQLDAVVDHALAEESLTDAAAGEQVDRAMLQHSGAHAVLDVSAAVTFENDGLDPAA